MAQVLRGVEVLRTSEDGGEHNLLKSDGCGWKILDEIGGVLFGWHWNEERHRVERKNDRDFSEHLGVEGVVDYGAEVGDVSDDFDEGGLGHLGWEIKNLGGGGLGDPGCELSIGSNGGIVGVVGVHERGDKGLDRSVND